ncbi:Transglutaminase-like superfamily protein [Brevibacterium iodinum ATCC 49514]|uniref:Transglutaminase-like superfamily protein n=1 Tax=Brevibacterium iodinum ATCC 49514 TaxID=1255616 RepID=A0A2H1KJ92_9MICO|nr:transglutaminase-like domain-containing protein [Brevibacterium iodinum]SMX99855.1 Transglutaminase-like superfamily protein [Brevibacterium iodinum ATCC 49514]SUW11391.1 Transglutaminase-like superfamily [Brevibacterium iodinum]
MTIIYSNLTEPTSIFDYQHPDVEQFLTEAGCFEEHTLSGAVERLHDAVRDSIDYNVFNVALGEELRSSTVVDEATGFCLHKSILFVAGCRRLGVPAILCSDVVTNHVSDEAMRELVGGEEFLHWYAQIYLDGRWIKAAPIFNALLCTIYGIAVLHFNPRADAIEQANTDGTGMRYMGHERSYTNPTMGELLQVIQDMHPRMVTREGRTPTSHRLTGAGLGN